MGRVNTAEIEELMFTALKDVLEGIIAGKVYRFGCRPLDSRQEDAVIVCSSATAEQIQEGFGRINIFVSDLLDAGTGAAVPNLSRIGELMGYADSLIDTLNAADSDYLFELDGAPTMIQEAELGQHFASKDEFGQHFANINVKFSKITF